MAARARSGARRGLHRDPAAGPLPQHAGRRGPQPDIEALAQMGGDEGADPTLRHQVAAGEQVRVPVAQAEPVGVDGADDRTLPGFHGECPGVLRQLPRHRGQRRVGQAGGEQRGGGGGEPVPGGGGVGGLRRGGRACAEEGPFLADRLGAQQGCAGGVGERCQRVGFGVVQPDGAHVEPDAAEFGRICGPGASADSPGGFQHHRAGAGLAQRGGGAEAGEAGADHHDIEFGHHGPCAAPAS